MECLRLVVLCLVFYGCGTTATKAPNGRAGDGFADITAVRAEGEAGAYTFFVGIRSSDTGCEQYADWWEVLDESGLIYRRILAHSHVDEQPFTRSGGPVDIQESASVFVRAHLNSDGYVGVVFEGSVAGGFAPVTSPPSFADSVASADPQPTGCAF